MSKKETDILLIRKYLNGELDARAMHQLESRAQDDPFLMDALEGYEKAKADQQPHLDNLHARLQNRVAHKERRLIPWRALTVAASIVVVFTIGGLWLYNNKEQAKSKIVALQLGQPERKAKTHIAQVNKDSTIIENKMAEVVKPSKPYSHKSLPVVRAIKNAEPDHTELKTIASADAAVAKPDDSDSTSLGEMVVLGMADKKADTVKKTITLAEIPIQKQNKDASTVVQLRGEAKGVSKTPAPAPTAFINGVPQMKIVAGKIIDKMDGSPLPGASIMLSGTHKGAVSDANGNFSIPVEKDKTNLIVASIGYQTQKIDVSKSPDSLNISLAPNNSSLNEVVVVGYGAQKKKDITAPLNAHPKAGWNDYKKYLNQNAISPDGKTGSVQLTFMVDTNGDISEIKVVRGLSPATNQKAIDLVTNGPAWIGNTSGQTEQVKLRIKFAAR